jgi:alpha-galactosidase
MQKSRDKSGNLQADPQKFPHGIKPVIKAVHALGLKFGIYEDAGYMTCAGFAASGWPKGGGSAHFLQDARLFASWGVDYLKLDGCNIYVAKGQTQVAAYRMAYKDESEALHRVKRPIVFLESAPAYFQGTPDWYDVLHWAGTYGQLWRDGTDIETYNAKMPDRQRFHSVLWNYAYNLPLGRFQKPGNWNNADFIIGGDAGMTLPETRSQFALWAMMSSPLILSSNLDKLSPAALAVLGNQAIIAVDQDPLGRMATLLRRSTSSDVLLKQLQHGEYAVAVLNRGTSPLNIRLHPADLGFQGKSCQWTAHNLWIGGSAKTTSTLHAELEPHDTAIWKFRPTSACGSPTRTGTVSRIIPNAAQTPESYTRCLASPGLVQACSGTPAETWTITRSGALQSSGKCLGEKAGKVQMTSCQSNSAQHWTYALSGNLINRKDHLCLTGSQAKGLTLDACGHNLATQIWSLPTPFVGD